jgi:hypothetical protein
MGINMATPTAQRKIQRKDLKEYTFVWVGYNRNDRAVCGDVTAAGSFSLPSHEISTSCSRSATLARHSSVWGAYLLRAVTDKAIATAMIGHNSCSRILLNPTTPATSDTD